MKLLGLRPSVKRLMMYQQGCSGAGTALRLVKDLAENNKEARVLVVCSELINLIGFHGPSNTALNVLVGQALNAHTGGRAIVNQIKLILGLKIEKLKATRHVLSDYGNMGSGTVLFVLDEMRKASINEGLGNTGEGLEWGVLCSFGSGLTIEAIALCSVSILDGVYIENNYLDIQYYYIS
ncbi:hypothetical protein HAX54_024691 [Datura stramonium]|uniref:Chalcone/stilbene synthase C-terminal domain-containing protein n=1 Tax=Datura stramonium TaxID=4076 RepID=A0ABS8RH06_DATST|nr:hypothetical protein [Datura stramonium]